MFQFLRKYARYTCMGVKYRSEQLYTIREQINLRHNLKIRTDLSLQIIVYMQLNKFI